MDCGAANDFNFRKSFTDEQSLTSNDLSRQVKETVALTEQKFIRQKPKNI
jgi:hypothetical protein